ncbi:hypothetical protein BsWGS_07456 [Bradybaena similaris]
MSPRGAKCQSDGAGSFLPLEDRTKEGSGRSRWLLRCLTPVLGSRRGIESRRKAVLRKNGTYRTFAVGLGEHTSKFLADIFITLIDLAWPYLVITLFVIYLLFVLAYATLWWTMAFHNGDFDNLKNPDHEFCLLGVSSFPGAIMFSVETQTTIGYGFSYPNPQCAATVPLMYLQVITGLLLETLMLGSVFVKIARPKHRTNTILFSRNAVVNRENGKLILQVRIGDLRKSHLVECSITGMVIHRHSTHEGVVYPLYQFNCEFAADGMGNRVFLLFPVIVKHVIDRDSPLYDVSPADLDTKKFEVVLYLTGTVESTGEMCQARTSYLPGELLWGHRFERIEEFDAHRGRWSVDFRGFDNVVHCQNISYSAAEIDRLLEDKADNRSQTPLDGDTTVPLLHSDLRSTSPHLPLISSRHPSEQSESKV